LSGRIPGTTKLANVQLSSHFQLTMASGFDEYTG
jgi:hypothetical protein